MVKDKYADCLAYIDDYWNKVTQQISKDNPLSGDIGLPNPYLSPNTERFRNQFYWDSYFMMLGVMGSSHEKIIPGMVDNFEYLFDTFTVFPNLSNIGGINRSQPPFFSDMILLKYQVTNSKEQLKKDFAYAKKEYDIVWTQKDPKQVEETIGHYHHTISGSLLSRYGDRDAGYALVSELESGWDLTSRFGSVCDEYLPVDLNSLLYRYEQNFITIAEILQDEHQQIFWKAKVNQRRRHMSELLWNKDIGFFFDYNYVTKKQSLFFSLAGFVPLWAGVATKEQSQKIVEHLPKFESEFGLTITTADLLSKNPDVSHFPNHYHSALETILTPKQWDYPNSWPPVDFLTIAGLLRYGYKEDAKRLMEKYLKAHAGIFRKHGRFFEKMDAVSGDVAVTYHYTNQGGFGWTNAVFKIFIELLDNPKNGKKYIR